MANFSDKEAAVLKKLQANKDKKEALKGLVPFREGFSKQESEREAGNIPLISGLKPQESVKEEPARIVEKQPTMIKKAIKRDAKKADVAIDKLQEGVTGEKVTKSNKMSDDMKSALIAGLPILIGGLLGGEEGLGVGAKAGLAGFKAKQAAEKSIKEGEQAEAELVVKRKEVDIKAAEQSSKADQRLIDIGLTKAKTITELRKNLPSNVDAKFKGLPAESQKRLSSIIAGDRAITEMTKSIQSGENLFEVLGESKYTDARNRFVEAIARLQSGAAISEKEFDIFTGFTPSSVEQQEIVREKMKRNRQFMSDNLKLTGFSRADLGLPVAPIGLQDKDELLSRKAELEAKRGQ